jgi:hypothetical protein
VVFDLEQLDAALHRRAGTWSRLGVVWRVEPRAANEGLPIAVARCESAAWLGDMKIWVTGEADLAAVCVADGRMVNKHFDLSGSADLEQPLDDFIGLVDRGDAPPGAATVWPRGSGSTA